MVAGEEAAVAVGPMARRPGAAARRPTVPRACVERRQRRRVGRARRRPRDASRCFATTRSSKTSSPIGGTACLRFPTTRAFFGTCGACRRSSRTGRLARGGTTRPRSRFSASRAREQNESGNAQRRGVPFPRKGPDGSPGWSHNSSPRARSEPSRSKLPWVGRRRGDAAGRRSRRPACGTRRVRAPTMPGRGS